VDVVDLGWDEIKWMIDEHQWLDQETMVRTIATFIEKGIVQDAVMKKAKHIISPSEITKKRVQEIYGGDSVVIPFNIRDDDYENPRVDGKITNRVLFFGRLDPRKGIDTVIKSIVGLLKISDDIEYVVAGRSNMETKYPKYFKRIKNPRIKYIPNVDDKERRDLYRGSDMVVIPSKYDPCPRTVSESLAQGTPVIGSNEVGSAVDCSKTEAVGIFLRDDPKSLVKSVARWYESFGGQPDLVKETRLSAVKVAKKFAPKERMNVLRSYFVKA
jgi:glycosyltransferase involved in cell wall biosynthesis